MSELIKIDIISDVMCPWCIIGYKRLAKAIAELEIENQVEVEWHPFQLNQGMVAEGEEVIGHISKKYGMSIEDAHQAISQMATLGAEVGFDFDFFEGFKMVNSSDLHVLLDFAKRSGKQTDFKLRLFNACFIERKNVSDRQVLVEEMKAVGLDSDKGLRDLKDQSYRDSVLEKEMYWKKQGVSGVPTMIFNGDSTFTGAQPVSVYRQVLSECLGNDHPRKIVPLASI